MLSSHDYGFDGALLLYDQHTATAANLYCKGSRTLQMPAENPPPSNSIQHDGYHRFAILF